MTEPDTTNLQVKHRIPYPSPTRGVYLGEGVPRQASDLLSGEAGPVRAEPVMIILVEFTRLQFFEKSLRWWSVGVRPVHGVRVSRHRLAGARQRDHRSDPPWNSEHLHRCRISWQRLSAGDWTAYVTAVSRRARRPTS
jgi:hypothetical protein